MNGLDEALRAAVQQYFCKLFDVLMSDPTDEGLGRFTKGLQSLAEMEDAVAKIIEEKAEG